MEARRLSHPGYRLTHKALLRRKLTDEEGGMELNSS